MNEKGTKIQSRTDWTRLEAMSDDDIDYSDIPPLTESFFQRAKLYVPEHLSVIIEKDVFAWFVNQEKEYQALINKVLRGYMEKKKKRLIKRN